MANISGELFPNLSIFILNTYPNACMDIYTASFQVFLSFLPKKVITYLSVSGYTILFSYKWKHSTNKLK